MPMENWRWLAAVIAAHPNSKVVGRTRLQKTVWLLQRLGLPTNYTYSLHFYGPYSEELKSDIGLAEGLGLITETSERNMAGDEYFVLTASGSTSLPDIREFRVPLELMAAESALVLELAATYDAFRKMGLSHDDALTQVRDMKGDKCENGRELRALALLETLSLESRAA